MITLVKMKAQRSVAVKNQSVITYVKSKHSTTRCEESIADYLMTFTTIVSTHLENVTSLELLIKPCACLFRNVAFNIG